MTPAAVKAVLKKTLSPHRFAHTLAVADLAETLARRHKADPRAAYRAGLLHDCAKELKGAELLAVVRAERLAVPGLRFIVKTGGLSLLHAHVSALWAKTKFGERSPDVCRAVERHTLGAPGMTLLDRVVYTADFASHDRRFGAAEHVRRRALENLDAGFREAVGLKIAHVVGAHRALHPQTVLMWNELVS